MTELIKFYAPWCQPCRVYGRNFSKFVSDKALQHREVNVDEQPDLAAQYGVTKLPTTVVLKDGQVKGKREGALVYSQLEELVGANA